jgi:hypothetical protein
LTRKFSSKVNSYYSARFKLNTIGFIIYKLRNEYLVYVQHLTYLLFLLCGFSYI